MLIRILITVCLLFPTVVFADSLANLDENQAASGEPKAASAAMATKSPAASQGLSQTESPEEPPSKPEKQSRNHKAERFVMPVTKWLEEKAHQSKVLNPTIKQEETGARTKNKTNLRQAILEAQKRFPGTVLSAGRSLIDEETVLYTIKILSFEGVLKELNIDESVLLAKQPHQEIDRHQTEQEEK